MGKPRIVEPSTQRSSLDNAHDFSLVLGGPLYQLYLSTRLARPALELLVRRLVGIPLICWLPLLLLAGAEGHLTGGVLVPFLRDPEVHIRFLVALPLLIASEVYVHQRMRQMAPQFLARGIIAPANRDPFEKIVASAMRLRNSALVEAILLLLVLTLGYWIWRQNFTLTVPTWYRVHDNAGLHLTRAGWFYAVVSLSIFRFIVIRWYFRLFIWYRFLWQVRALPLHFNLYHPDRAGGLGFLSGSTEALAPVFVAQTAVLSGAIFTHILYSGERLSSFKAEIGVILALVVLVIVTPLGFFARQLDETGRKAKRRFGILASHYVDDFDLKWDEGEVRTGESFLGTPDLQSLADLANSFAVVSRIRLVPISKEVLVRLVLLVALPLLPLPLTMFPLDEVLKRIFKLVF